mmetsp:Transcript_84101/g.187756  ORF Transcript_84101/g.187756 Transcript_84101/m.187756 type:complete len:275 (-) Transcript_84101:910-1734(-)
MSSPPARRGCWALRQLYASSQLDPSLRPWHNRRDDRGRPPAASERPGPLPRRVPRLHRRGPCQEQNPERSEHAPAEAPVADVASHQPQKAQRRALVSRPAASARSSKGPLGRQPGGSKRNVQQQPACAARGVPRALCPAGAPGRPPAASREGDRTTARCVPLQRRPPVSPVAIRGGVRPVPLPAGPPGSGGPRHRHSHPGQRPVPANPLRMVEGRPAAPTASAPRTTAVLQLPRVQRSRGPWAHGPVARAKVRATRVEQRPPQWFSKGTCHGSP